MIYVRVVLKSGSNVQIKIDGEDLKAVKDENKKFMDGKNSADFDGRLIHPSSVDYIHVYAEKVGK